MRRRVAASCACGEGAFHTRGIGEIGAEHQHLLGEAAQPYYSPEVKQLGLPEDQERTPQQRASPHLPVFEGGFHTGGGLIGPELVQLGPTPPFSFKACKHLVDLDKSQSPHRKSSNLEPPCDLQNE